MSYRIIESETDISEATAALTDACRHMAKVYEVTGKPPLRRRENGFPGLARIIVGQQLSVASASAIWNRLERAVKPFDAETYLRKRAPTLRRCGLSAGKMTTLKGIARAVASGQLDLAALADATDVEIKETLTTLKGVGPWTADIYIMFCLGRADGWAPGDLALRYAAQESCGLKEIPDEAEMVTLAEQWRPWRSVAARMLWAYYGIKRSQKDVQPA
ncbi:MAG: DNA-3-methyladenine glycosylase 2 family protein [Hyphomicrobiaceae bacterium]|nr:DNA-3-methyladenine glycosylase 2 family protein [Hyphomicrobiaceae bacterium]